MSSRKVLRRTTAERLSTETFAIESSPDPHATAVANYSSARRAAWFRPITEALARLSGHGQRCMCCSGSEATQVEHYRPKAIYPGRAFDWHNLLWVCGVCNQYKGDRFDEGAALINPIDDRVWEYFFIDEFGNLCARWNPALGDLDPRAERTIEVLALDREPLQESRLARLLDLRKKIADAMTLMTAGGLGPDELEVRALEWFEQPFQPDVADYFFDGPGHIEEPFKGFFMAAGLQA